MLDFSRSVALLLAASGLARAATVITYPGWRGNNLITNGTKPQNNPDALGVDYIHGAPSFPFGMQYMYPCGGMPQTNNRSYWPYNGGALSIQPGWGAGNQKSLFYVNMGIQDPNEQAPPNISLNVVPPFAVIGPNSTSSFTGQFCLPQVPMPVNATLNPDDLITIQVVQVQATGAAEYNCVDIHLVDDHDPRLKTVTNTNCYNSTNFQYDLVFTTADLNSPSQSGASFSLLRGAPSSGLVALFVMFVVSAVSALSR